MPSAIWEYNRNAILRGKGGSFVIRAGILVEIRVTEPCGRKTIIRQPARMPRPIILRCLRFSDIEFVLTARLSQAGPVVSDCKLRADPGLGCSRMVSFWDSHRALVQVAPNPDTSCE